MDANSNHRADGAVVESLALQYLLKQGMTLVERNYYSRFGEIDLIMHHQNCIIFVEVRHRLSARYGGALESIHWHKQQKLRKTATLFLTRQQLHSMQCRFDVLCYSGKLSELNDESTPLWIKNAF